jgi:hypothetical protein
VSTNFADFLDQNPKSSRPCLACRFFVANKAIHAEINEQIAKRGLFAAPGRPTRADASIRLKDIVRYVKLRKPESHVTYISLASHYRNKHEETL